jgi:uncharacterized membrane protein YvbJ
MATCPKCGLPVKPDTVYCPNCGTVLKKPVLPYSPVEPREEKKSLIIWAAILIVVVIVIATAVLFL